MPSQGEKTVANWLRTFWKENYKEWRVHQERSVSQEGWKWVPSYLWRKPMTPGVWRANYSLAPGGSPSCGSPSCGGHEASWNNDIKSWEGSQIFSFKSYSSLHTIPHQWQKEYWHYLISFKLHYQKKQLRWIIMNLRSTQFSIIMFFFLFPGSLLLIPFIVFDISPHWFPV